LADRACLQVIALAGGPEKRYDIHGELEGNNVDILITYESFSAGFA